MNDPNSEPIQMTKLEQAAKASQAGMGERLVGLLHESFDRQQAIVLTLTEAEKLASGTMEIWSMKDTLAHIVAWSDVLNIRLEMLARGETPQEYEDDDKINAEFYQARRNLSWSAIMETSRKAYTRLVERIQTFTETDLTDPGRYAWMKGVPLWRRILGTAYVHPLTHLAFYYNQRGQPALGLKMQVDAARKLLAFDPDPAWQSQVVYNLACQYALSGDRKTAVAKLRQALIIDTGLLEWSQQDPDFNAFRDNPEFQAIYTDFGSQ